MSTKAKKNQTELKRKMVKIGIDIHKLSWRIIALVEGDIVLAVILTRSHYDSFKKSLLSLKVTMFASLAKLVLEDLICMTGLPMMAW